MHTGEEAVETHGAREPGRLLQWLQTLYTDFMNDKQATYAAVTTQRRQATYAAPVPPGPAIDCDGWCSAKSTNHSDAPIRAGARIGVSESWVQGRRQFQHFIRSQHSFASSLRATNEARRLHAWMLRRWQVDLDNLKEPTLYVRSLKYACVRRDGRQLPDQRQSAKNGNANAHLHHEKKKR